MTVYISGTNLTWEPVEEGVRRVLAVGENSSAILYTCQPGYVSTPEIHPEEQGNYIVRGTEEYFVGPEGQEQYYLCPPGSLLITGPNERHWCRVVGSEQVLKLCFFSPPRESHRRAKAQTR